MGQDFQTHKDRIEYEKDQGLRKKWFIKAGLVYLLVIVGAWYFGQWMAERFL